MTAPRIPDTAIRAAARELCQFQAHDHYVVNGETCGPSEDAAEAVLAAALPLLGDTTTEYSVRVDHRGETPHVLGDTERLACHRNRGEAERGAWRLRGFQTTTTVVQRTVITGEWTEAPSE